MYILKTCIYKRLGCHYLFMFLNVVETSTCWSVQSSRIICKTWHGRFFREFPTGECARKNVYIQSCYNVYGYLWPFKVWLQLEIYLNFRVVSGCSRATILDKSSLGLAFCATRRGDSFIMRIHFFLVSRFLPLPRLPAHNLALHPSPYIIPRATKLTEYISSSK